MSQAPFGSPPPGPPPRASGMSTLLIVLIVLGILVVVCCGGCIGACYFGGSTMMGAGLTQPVLLKLNTNQEVMDKFGGRVDLAGLPSSSSVNLQPGATSTVDFEVMGPNGKGQVHAELKNGPNGLEPTVIRVTAPDGTVINVPTASDPTDINIPEFDLDGGIQIEEETK